MVVSIYMTIHDKQCQLREIFIVLVFDGVVIAAQSTATFLRSIVLPRIWVLGREYAD